MIERELANVTDLAITRPVRQGSARDQSATAVSVATGLCAIYEQTDASFTGPDGTERQITGRLIVDPVNNAGEALEVRPDDLVAFSDYTGRTLKPRKVIRVEAYWACAELDHLEIEFA